jgi:hypothetical protein
LVTKQTKYLPVPMKKLNYLVTGELAAAQQVEPV